MNLRSVFGIFVCLFVSGAPYISLVHAEPGGVQRRFVPGRDLTLALFEDITRFWVARATGHSQDVIEFIRALVEQHQNKWHSKDGVNRLVSYTDQAGNLILRIPATGRYALRRNVPSIALQTTLDCPYVMNVSGETHAATLHAGAPLAQTREMVHAWDRTGAIGARSGLGISIALRYLIDRSLEHPPLELIFTPHATKVTLEVQSAVVINLNGTHMKEMVVGNQGVQTVRTTAIVAGTRVPEGYSRVTMNVVNLLGGDSVRDLHRRRVMAVPSAAALLSKISNRIPEMMLLEVQIGGTRKLESLPQRMEISIAVPTARTREVDALFTRHMHDQISTSDEREIGDRAAAPASSFADDPMPAGATAIDGPSVQRITQSILSLPSGIRPQSAAVKPRRFSAVNLGYWSMKAGDLVDEKPALFFKLGAMLRSFSASLLADARQEIDDALRECEVLGDLTQKISRTAPPLLTELTPIQKLTTETLNVRPVWIQGAHQIGALAAVFPDKEIFALGPTVLDADTAMEQFSRHSILEFQDRITRLVGAIADFSRQCPEWLSGTVPPEKQSSSPFSL